MQPIKIVIVEDLQEVIEGLTTFIRKNSQLNLMATFRTAEAAVIELPVLNPDVVIMDINLPGITGIECIKQVKVLAPAIQFMIFTVYENNDQVLDALKAGASGYLLKKTPPEKIIEAIIELHEGGSPMSSTIARKLVHIFQTNETKPVAQDALLTPREKEVLNSLAKGMQYKEIADALNISFHTVRKHICTIYEKLHVQNKTEAINKVFGSRI